MLHKKIKKALRIANLNRFKENSNQTLKVTSEEITNISKLLKGFPKASFLTLKWHSEDVIDFTIKNNEIGFQLWRDRVSEKWFLQVSNFQLKAATWKTRYQEVYIPISSKEKIIISFEDDFLDSYIKILNTTLISI